MTQRDKDEGFWCCVEERGTKEKKMNAWEGTVGGCKQKRVETWFVGGVVKERG